MKNLIKKLALSLMLLAFGGVLQAQPPVMVDYAVNISLPMTTYPNYGTQTYLNITFQSNIGVQKVGPGAILIQIGLTNGCEIALTGAYTAPPGWLYTRINNKNGTLVNTDSISSIAQVGPSAAQYFQVPFTPTAAVTNLPILAQASVPLLAPYNDNNSNNDAAVVQLNVDNSAPLGVQFSAFNAVSKGCSNEIYWSTATEIGNNHFDVERSIDGRVFASINKVPSKGSKNATQDYSFVDANPINGTNYYRVRQTDNDGVTSVTVVRKVETDCSKAVISIFPNPTLSVLNVNGLEKGQIIEIYNTLGQSILKTTVKNETEVVDMAEFVNGTYNFRVFSNGVAIFNTKVVKN